MSENKMENESLSLFELMERAIVRTREKELEREGLPSEGVTIRRLDVENMTAEELLAVHEEK